MEPSDADAVDPLAVAADVAPGPRLFNRELSWLDFNHRVLELAGDDTIPLLERLRFCSIYANNLDEFFMVRVAGLIDHVVQGTVPSDGTPPQETLDEIAGRYRLMLTQLEDLLHGSLLPSLAREGIQVVALEELEPEEREEIATVFDQQLYPVLTPLAVGPGQPFPYISNLSLSVGVTVRDPSTGETRFARVKVPEVLPRLIRVGEASRFVRIDDVIAHGLPALFPGMEIVGSSTFRVTRDADFELKEGADDLLEAVERELSRRRFGDVVRLEIDEAMPADMRSMLIEALDVDLRQVFATRPPLDLSGLNVLTRVPRPDLRFSPWQPQVPERLVTADDTAVDMFAEIRRGDILVHHPYESFTASVERFIEQAVADPEVLAIKHTIYRTSGDAPIVPALAIAAEQGKQAVALVEVTARFDEERNIRWARALERAGVHVVHGRVGRRIGHQEHGIKHIWSVNSQHCLSHWQGGHVRARCRHSRHSRLHHRGRHRRLVAVLAVCPPAENTTNNCSKLNQQFFSRHHKAPQSTTKYHKAPQSSTAEKPKKNVSYHAPAVKSRQTW